jgi:hypothetical protein
MSLKVAFITVTAMRTSNVTRKKLKVLGRTNRQLSFDTTRNAHKTSPTILLCCANVFTEPLPSNGRGGYTYRHTGLFWLHYSGSQAGGDTQEHRYQYDLISLLPIFPLQNKESRLIMRYLPPLFRKPLLHTTLFLPVNCV